MRKILKIVEYNKATKWQRFAHYIIDKITLHLLVVLMFASGVLIDNILGIYYFTDWVDRLSQIGRFADMVFTSVLYFIYTFLMEYFTGGRTLGKYITGTKVITTDGQTPTVKDFFIRNISRIVPFDGLSFLGENGWHDSWSDTRVVHLKKYEAERQAKTEIESIGTKEIA